MLVCVFIFAGWDALAQNTKGDRPVNNQRQVRETKGKSVKKKQKVRTKDVAGRRLRTKNKSSASRANASFPQPDPYRERPRETGERPASPRGKVFSRSPRESRTQGWRGDISGHKLRKIKPSKSGIARTNVYPQNGPYVNNPSRKPRDGKRFRNAKTASGKPIVRRQPPKSYDQAWRGNQKGRRIKIQSATPKIRNTYPQKGGYSLYYSKTPPKSKTLIYSNKRVPGKTRISTSSSGVVRSPIPRSRTGMFVKRGKKNVYWGKFRKGERAFQGDITGGPIRGRNFRTLPPGLVGRDTLKWFGRKPGGDRPYRGKRGRNIKLSSNEQRGWKNDIAGFKIRSPRKQKGEVAGKFVFPRKLSVTESGNVGRPVRGSRGNASVSGRRPGNRPLPAKDPGINTFLIGKRLARTKGTKPLQGGGSRSGPFITHKPVQGREPGINTFLIGKNLARTKGKKPAKGGGSISGQLWNNDEQPIQVRKPKSDEMKGFSGNLKVKRGYKKNPNAAELALQKRKPKDPVFDAGGLIVKQKQDKYGKKPYAADDALLGKVISPNGRRAGEFSGSLKLRQSYKNPKSHELALRGKAPSKTSVKASEYSRSMKRNWKYKHNPSNDDDALMVRNPSQTWRRATSYEGKTKLIFSYRSNPSSREGALKVRYPGKAFARATDYQGNIKMKKFNDRRLHPDAQFAHNKLNNVKGERTFLTDVKLLWAKWFKKGDNQPSNVKEKSTKPRYDKGEKGLWAGDPDYKNKDK